jgi:4-hydroxybenzoate polyprenyltransferase
MSHASHEPHPQRWQLVRSFLEMIRFSHTVFALPFCLLACVFAIVVPSQLELTPVQLSLRIVAVLLCMVTARSAAMAFNRLVDARIDAANPRTAKRHLPSGRLSRLQVWTFFGAMCGLFILSCLLFLPNWLPVACSGAVLAWICGYSFAKRFTAAAHLWLGVALALSPICAWVAVRGEVLLYDPADLLPALVLASGIVGWVAGFDIIYACQDADFDRVQKLYSVPARFGVAGGLRIAAGFHLLMLIALATLPLFPELQLGWIYGLGLTAVGALIVTQHALVRPGDLARVNVAFFHINAILSLGFCTLAAVDAWLA